MHASAGPAAVTLADRFASEGFVVIRQAVPSALIDAVLHAQRGSRLNPLLIFRGQGVVGYERAKWNQHGQMVRSIQNPHLLGFAPRLSASIRRLVFSDAIAKALADCTDVSQWVNWQTMLFDRSVGTDVHLDTWFLDTQPRGHLIGAWIALEEIRPESGPFIVYPRSHNLLVDTEMNGLVDLSARKDQLHDVIRRHQLTPKQLLLGKGDLVLWNSLVAHGSELPASPVMTRKSVTAHFYPLGMPVMDPPIRRSLSIYDHEKPCRTQHPQLRMAATINPCLYSSICTGMYFVQGLKPSRAAVGAIRRA